MLPDANRNQFMMNLRNVLVHTIRGDDAELLDDLKATLFNEPVNNHGVAAGRSAILIRALDIQINELRVLAQEEEENRENVRF